MEKLFRAWKNAEGKIPCIIIWNNFTSYDLIRLLFSPPQYGQTLCSERYTKGFLWNAKQKEIDFHKWKSEVEDDVDGFFFFLFFFLFIFMLKAQTFMTFVFNHNISLVFIYISTVDFASFRVESFHLEEISIFPLSN